MFYIMLSAIEDEQERLKIAEIYETHRHKCLRAALNILKNQQLAEDAVQDAFISVIEHKEKIFSLSCNLLPSYIVTIVKHKAIDILRKNKRVSDDDMSELEKKLESGEILVDDQVIGNIEFKRLYKHVSELDEKYKFVFEMKYVLCLSNKEIAEIMNITLENVRVRLHRARSQLKKIIESEVCTNV